MPYVPYVGHSKTSGQLTQSSHHRLPGPSVSGHTRRKHSTLALATTWPFLRSTTIFLPVAGEYYWRDMHGRVGYGPIYACTEALDFDCQPTPILLMEKCVQGVRERKGAKVQVYLGC